MKLGKRRSERSDVVIFAGNPADLLLYFSIDKSAFLLAVRRVAPSLAPWVEFGYAKPSHSLPGDRLLDSDRGIQQGDPIGPALFARGIHDAVLKAKQATAAVEEWPLDFAVFYLYDGTIVGHATAVYKFCKLFQGEMAAMGLKPSISKCEMVAVAGGAYSFEERLVPWMQLETRWLL